MKIYCCYTPAHEVLLRDYFGPSLPSDFELITNLIPLSGRGDFLSTEFLECIRRKMDAVIGSLERSPREVIVWSDIDIMFFEVTAKNLQTEFDSSGKEILFQRESKITQEVNTGFIVCRSSPAMIHFFKEVKNRLLAQPDKNEQWIINDLLNSEITPKWGFLSGDYYARTHGWPPPPSIRIYHANYTLGPDGIGQKIRQFHELHLIRKFGLPARIYVAIRLTARKIKRRLGLV